MPKSFVSYIMMSVDEWITEFDRSPCVDGRVLWNMKKESWGFAMFHMNRNKKRNQCISAVIVILLVLAMVIPTVVSVFY